MKKIFLRFFLYNEISIWRFCRRRASLEVTSSSFPQIPWRSVTPTACFLDLYVVLVVYIFLFSLFVQVERWSFRFPGLLFRGKNDLKLIVKVRKPKPITHPRNFSILCLQSVHCTLSFQLAFFISIASIKSWCSIFRQSLPQRRRRTECDGQALEFLEEFRKADIYNRDVIVYFFTS